MKILSSPIQRLFPKRIWHQIFAVLVCVIVIPLIVLGLLLIRTAHQAIKTTVFRDHKEVAVQATAQVAERIEGARQSLLIAASVLSALPDDPWRQETVIVELSLNNPAFERVAVVNPDGRETATSQLGTVLRDRSAEHAFRRALTGDSFLSKVRLTDGDVPYLTLAEPLRQAGKVVGVLMADLNVRGIWDNVDQIQFGEHGLAYIIDGKGRIIAHRDKKLVMQEASVPDPRILQDILSGRSGNVATTGPAGEKLLVSYAPIRNVNWGLVISQPERDAYAYAQTMRAQSWLIILLGILATVLTSFLLARFVGRPINELISATERLAKGDFTQRFRVRQRNEIGRLMFSFNRMTAQLRRARDMRNLSVIGNAATRLAHELKNSLQMVTTFVKLLPERSHDKKFLQEFADTIPGELDSWNASLRNMMIFSQRESPFPTTAVDINVLLGDMALLTKLKLRQMDIRIVTDLPPGLPPVEGNEDKLKQVFLNMMTNALESAPRGTTVEVTACRQPAGAPGGKDAVEIMMSNACLNLEGFEPERIFEPFYTTKTGGFGLGLSISREVVERHGGCMWAQADTVRQRISFIVRLPEAGAMRPTGPDPDLSR
ncbi:MAG: Cache 3/Cache 2 fusion domain-containing protein [Candidatus Omnitrophica bacterium]|nr:Cache 3/Cache 2 fusion domain-containing protein [Candidatus Omnitrophota bacterium]